MYCITEMKIVALHGQMGMGSDWGGLAGRLAVDGYEMEAVDLWSYLEDGELRMEEFGKEFNERQSDRQVLLGYSMGGRLALHALIDEPKKWKAAVIISAHSGLPLADRTLRRSTDGEWASRVESLPWAKFLSQWNGQGVLGNDVMPDRSKLEERRAEISRSFRCWSLAEQENLLEKLQAIEIPVLWVVGERDEKFCNVGEAAVSKLKNGKMIKVLKSGHRVPWEAEEYVAGEITEWLSEVL